MSDTEIWGACGHNWLAFACYAARAIEDEIEARAVDAQADARERLSFASATRREGL
jgi:hypothetical protein